MEKKLLVLLFCVLLFSSAGNIFASEIIIHDDGPNGPNDPYGPGFVKDKTECVCIIEAEDGIKTGPTGQFGEIGDGNCHLWLYDGSSVTVTCPEPTDVVYVQSMGSDGDDGYADYYVDGVLEATVQTWMRGVWYIEIKGLEETAHTVEVVAREGVVNLDYFGFGDMPQIVDLDIKPCSCPNPFNVKSKGVLPAAILGADDLDVSLIDAASIRLEGVAPVRSNIEDVATPVLPDEQETCACTVQGADGYADLTLKFDTQEVVQAIGLVEDGEWLILTITGELADGKKIEGTDCIRIIKKDEHQKIKCKAKKGK